MNIDKVYFCDICQLTDIVYNVKEDNVDFSNGFNLDTFLGIRRESVFVGKTLVYYSKYKKVYIDLMTKRKYKLGNSSCSIGDYYIDTKTKLVPLREVTSPKRKNMTKKKILEKYNGI